jgi:hypothetical protein
LQPLQAAADHHQAPAVILGHVVERVARETRQGQEQRVERLPRIAPACAASLNSRCRTPIARQFSADKRLRACAAHQPRRCISARRLKGLASSNSDGATKFPHVARTSGHSSRIGAHTQGGAQQPRLVLASLAVAAEPE